MSVKHEEMIQYVLEQLWLGTPGRVFCAEKEAADRVAARIRSEGFAAFVSGPFVGHRVFLVDVAVLECLD